MIAPWKRIAVGAVVLGCGTGLHMAWADDGPAIPVRDLPPFPEVDTTARVSEVSVYGASQSEEETVVGAAKREQSLGTVASAVTVLTADHLRRYGYRSLAEALRGAAGVFVVDDRSCAAEKISIRTETIELFGIKKHPLFE